MAAQKSDVVQGTLDLLVLKVVAMGPIHGYAIAQRILTISREVLQVQQGSLYPALYRLEERGFLQSEWRESEQGRMAKFYTLTKKGRARLQTEKEQWERVTGAIALVLQAAEDGGAR
jgi:transcriptional regulator